MSTVYYMNLPSLTQLESSPMAPVSMEHHQHWSCHFAVALNTSPCCPADPTVWFAQVEVQFTCHGIVQPQTCFDDVITPLTPEMTIERYTPDLADSHVTPPSSSRS